MKASTAAELWPGRISRTSPTSYSIDCRHEHNTLIEKNICMVLTIKENGQLPIWECLAWLTDETASNSKWRTSFPLPSLLNRRFLVYNYKQTWSLRCKFDIYDNCSYLSYFQTTQYSCLPVGACVTYGYLYTLHMSFK